MIMQLWLIFSEQFFPFWKLGHFVVDINSTDMLYDNYNITIVN